MNVATLQSGAKIRVRGFSKPVIFRRLDGSSAEIEAGPLRMKVAVDEIIGVEGAAPGKVAISPNRRDNVTVSRAVEGTSAASGEINVIGMTVEQASELVDKFIDESVLPANRACASFMAMGPVRCVKALLNFSNRILRSRQPHLKPRNTAAKRSQL